uniref:Cytochrome P450 n=1 Tax=Panagrolaimus davidi TaxID=227884 RepID=A0A914PMC5_9BILA
MLDVFISVFILLITSFAFLYVKFIYDSNYWKRRGIAGPYHLKTNSIENQAPLVLNINYPNVLLFRDWTKEYGPIYGYNEGQRKVLVISNPEIAHEVMVKKFEYFHGRKLNPIVGDVVHDPRVHVFNAKGARWKRLRNTASPCFNAANLKKILPTIQDCANVTKTFLDKAYETKKPFNIHSYFQEFTMDVICRVALGQDKTLQFENPNVELVKQVLFVFANNPFDYWAHVFPKIGPYLKKIMFAIGKFKHIPIKDCIDQLYETVAKRKAERVSVFQRKQYLQ